MLNITCNDYSNETHVVSKYRVTCVPLLSDCFEINCNSDVCYEWFWWWEMTLHTSDVCSMRLKSNSWKSVMIRILNLLSRVSVCPRDLLWWLLKVPLAKQAPSTLKNDFWQSHYFFSLHFVLLVEEELHNSSLKIKHRIEIKWNTFKCRYIF